MKTIFFVFSLLVGACVIIGIVAVLAAAANQVGPGLDAANAAVKAYPWEGLGHLLAGYIIMAWKIEVAKLMFWIHLFG